MGTLAGEHHKLLTSEKSVELVRSLARETVAGGKIDDPQLLNEIRVLGRDQREASVIPTEEAKAWTRLTCEADAVWHKGRRPMTGRALSPMWIESSASLSIRPAHGPQARPIRCLA